MLKGKKLLIGITGGIAAYKSASVIRLLVKEGADVKVIMTDHARISLFSSHHFNLSRNPVMTGHSIRERNMEQSY